MGQDESQYQGFTQILEGRDIPSLVKYMKSDLCKNVIVMVSPSRYNRARSSPGDGEAN